jgi:hypothetical protein
MNKRVARYNEYKQLEDKKQSLAKGYKENIGSGKSILIQMLAGELPLLTGILRRRRKGGGGML